MIAATSSTFFSTSVTRPCSPLIGGAARLAHQRGDLLDLLLDVLFSDRAELAAPDLVADAVPAGDAGPHQLRRIGVALDVVAVGELPLEILVEQRNAVVHV